jgi:outer membrane protein OmpA-like peptidoglycan-associated protein
MKKSYSIFVIGLGFILGGCGAGLYVKKANRSYDAYAYSDALPLFQKALEKDGNSYAAKKGLADTYRMMNNPVEAEKQYKDLVAMAENEAINHFHYGKVLMQNQKYSEAKKAFEEYAKTNPEDKVIKSLIEAAGNPKTFDGKLDTCAYSLKMIEASGLMSALGGTPYNFGYVFAGEYAITDESPKKSKNPYTGNAYMDLFFTKKDKKNGVWSKPEPLKGGVNSEFHDAFATFSPDGQTVYFTRTQQKNGKMILNKDKVSNLEILKATYIDGEWTNLESFIHNSPDFSNGHPSLSADGKTLYFSSDRPGGYGATDLYMCTWNGTAWDAPVNCGPMINTPGREVMPQIGFDGKLYFSSDGHPGLGGLDIFSTTRNGSSWTMPQNLKTPINSSRDDFSFTLDSEGKVGNLTSSRSGADKLYEVIYKDVFIPIEVCLVDKETRKPAPGLMVYAQNKDNGEIDSTMANSEGQASFRLKGNFDFIINARSAQVLTNSIEITTKGKSCAQLIRTCDENKFVEVEAPDWAKEYDITDIYYDYNKWNIRKDAAKQLDKLVTLLKNNPNFKIELGSHTDCRGSEEYNQQLSEKRAEAVVKYCTNRDIDPKRLTYKGYGESVPKSKCICESCSETEWQMDRRTVFKLMK